MKCVAAPSVFCWSLTPLELSSRTKGMLPTGIDDVMEEGEVGFFRTGDETKTNKNKAHKHVT